MNKKWLISKNQKKIFDTLLKNVNKKEIRQILDIGTGRTSLHYLTKTFPKSKVTAMIYPGDKKLIPIKKCIATKNYNLKEINFIKFRQMEKYDLVFAHLFLGESERFLKNKFENVLNKLFSIKTKYLVIIDVLDDYQIDYRKILKKIASKKILNIYYRAGKIKFTSGKEYNGFIGFLVRCD